MFREAKKFCPATKTFKCAVKRFRNFNLLQEPIHRYSKERYTKLHNSIITVLTHSRPRLFTLLRINLISRVSVSGLSASRCVCLSPESVSVFVSLRRLLASLCLFTRLLQFLGAQCQQPAATGRHAAECV